MSKVTIYRWWAKGRLWLDANDVLNALELGGYTNAAGALSAYVDQIKKADGR